MAGFNIDDYVTVPERVVSFYEKFPDGSLQSEVIELSDTRVVMRAYAYRTPDDVRPGIGHSMLGIPGSTPYTKGSEVENCETSAVGRAIAMLGFHVKKSIASRNEIETKGGQVKADVEHGPDGSLIGVVQVGDRAKSSDFLLYNEAETGHYLGFRLRGEKGGILVRTYGQLARDLMTLKAQVVGQRVTVWGRVADVPPEGKMRGYQVLDADRVSVPGLPPLPTVINEPAPVEAASEPLFDELERIGA